MPLKYGVDEGVSFSSYFSFFPECLHFDSTFARLSLGREIHKIRASLCECFHSTCYYKESSHFGG